MKVLLINPRADHEMKGPHPLKVEDMGIFPHLGLMYIASILREKNEFDVKLVDMTLEGLSIPYLVRILADWKPSVVGITSYTDCLYDLKLTVEALRKELESVIICAGGPHVEIYPKDTLRILPIDCIIRGDGEYSFRELCRQVKNKKSWKNIKGIGYNDRGKVYLNDPWQIEPIDVLPFPARELSSMDRVKSTVAKGKAITSICSSRGCPLPCTFCNSPYKKYRLRSAENVVTEIADCYEKLGIREFFFFDDLFNISKKRMIEICDAIKKLPFKIKWSFRGRINNLDEPIIRRCQDAGCNRIHFGVEAGTERILNIYKKGLKLDRVRNIFKICHKIEMETVGNFMIGGPSETREEINQTLRFAFELSPTFVEFHVLVPYPYTQIYQKMLASGQLETDVWENYSKNPKSDFNPPLCNTEISSKELYEILNDAYRKFYFRPSYIWKQMKRIESLNDLGKKILGAFRLILVTRAVDKIP